MPTSKLVSIAHLPRSLAVRTGQPAPSARKIYQQVVDGLIPAEYLRGRWYFNQHKLPEIAEALGLTPARQRDAE